MILRTWAPIRSSEAQQLPVRCAWLDEENTSTFGSNNEAMSIEPLVSTDGFTTTSIESV